jgi:hypothetical protein
MGTGNPYFEIKAGRSTEFHYILNSSGGMANYRRFSKVNTSGSSVYGLTFNLDSNLTTAYLDGKLLDTTIYSLSPKQNGNKINLFSNRDKNQRPDGFIGEVLIYGSALSAGDRIRVEDYLAHKWSLTKGVPNIGELFQLESNGSLSTIAPLNYETDSNHTLRIRSQDPSGSSYEQDFVVTINNVIEDLDADGTEDPFDNDKDGDGLANDLELTTGSDPIDANSSNRSPSEVNSTAPLDLPENTLAGTVFGQILGIDPDADANLTYSLGPVFPSDLSPGVWLDADSPSSLWQNTGKTYSANETGDAIALWLDRSANERNATQSSFSLQPLLRKNHLNGRDVLRFDGANFLSVDFSWLANKDYTIIAVEGRRSSKNDNYYLLNNSGGNNQNGHFGYYRNNRYKFDQRSNNLEYYLDNYSSQVFRAWTHWFDNAEGHKLYLNGTKVASNFSLTGFSAVNSGKIGCGYHTNYKYYGDIAEIIAFPSALEQDRVEQVHEYLSLKWGLPSAKPYIGARFILESNGTLRAGTPFDYENNATSYPLLVRAKDEFNATVENIVTVQIGNVWEDTDGDGTEDAFDLDIDGDGMLNEDEELYNSNPYNANSINHPPYDLNSTATLIFDENASAGTIIGMLTGSDPDNNATLTYSLENPWSPWKVTHLTGDGDSGVSSAYNYTCAVNVNGSADKVVNGVTFKAYTGTNGPGWQIIQNFHKGHNGQNSTVKGQIGEVLDNRMRYEGNPSKILITGLTPGKPYVFAFYNQAWGTDNKTAIISCSALAQSVSVDQGQFKYSMEDGQLVECRYIANSAEVQFTVNGSWYLYGFSNREAESENHLFNLDTNGTLYNASNPFDYEKDRNHTIRVRVTDDHDVHILRNLIVHVGNIIEDIDGDGIEDSNDSDIDGDGMSNAIELTNGSNPLDSNSINFPPNEINATGTFTLAENEANSSYLGEFTSSDNDFNSSVSLSLVPSYPNDLTPSVWLDASDTSTIEVSSGKVNRWLDKSGNGNHFVQPLYVKRPVTGTRTKNSLNVIDFDGNDWMGTGDPFPTGDNYSIFMVAKVDAVNEPNDSLFHIGPNAPSFQFNANHENSFRLNFAQSSMGTSQSFSSIPVSGSSVFGFVFDLNRSILSAYLNGQPVGSAGYTTPASQTNNQLNLFSNRGLDEHPEGFAAEFLFYPSVLGDIDRGRVEKYLSHKWNLNYAKPRLDELFVLEANGTLNTIASLDYESDSNHSIRVRATDELNATLDRDFSITVINVVEDFDLDGIEDHYDPDDDGDGFLDTVEIAYGSDPRDPNSVANVAPTDLNATPSTFPENLPANSKIADLVATDADTNASFTFHLIDGNGSTHNSLFQVIGANRLHALPTFDFETNSTTYTLRLKTIDEHNASFEKSITLTLGNVVEDLDLDGIEDHFDLDDDGDGFLDSIEIAYGSDPRDSSSVANAVPSNLHANPSSFTENLPLNSKISEFSATDADANASFIFSLVDGNGSTHNSLFQFIGTKSLHAIPSFDFESNVISYSIRVRVYDEHNASFEKVLLFTLTNVIEDLDGDGTEDHYDLDDDNDGFSDTVEISYGSDPRNINSVANATPSSLNLTNNNILENKLIGTSVGQIIAVDPDPDAILSISFTEGAGSENNSLFTIDQNRNLRSNRIFNFEVDPLHYSIRIRATDQHGFYIDNNFTVSLLNVIEDLDSDGVEDHYDLDDDNDGFVDSVELAYGSDPRNKLSVANAPPSSLTLNRTNMMENAPIGTKIASFTALDPDPDAILALDLVPGEGSDDNSLFDIDKDGNLRIKRSFDFETDPLSYSILVGLSDQHGFTLEKSFTIFLLNVVEDLDGDKIENHYDLDDDGDGFSDWDEIAYGSDPENRKSVANASPTSLSLENYNIFENSPVGTKISKILAVDPDQDAILSFSFVEGEGSENNELFEIDELGNLITKHVFDYETDKISNSICLRTTDQHGYSIERILKLSLINVVEDLDLDGIEDHYDLDDDNDGFKDSVEISYGSDPRNSDSVANATPYSIELMGTNISENKPAGFVIGSIIANDSDLDASLSFSLIKGEGLVTYSLFDIDDDDLLITNRVFDYETDAMVYSVCIRATDQHGFFIEKIFSISLSNQIEDLDGDGIEDYYDGDYDEQVKSIEINSSWWSTLPEIAGGWRTSTWFGSFRPYPNGWLYHADLGWLYSHAGESRDLWLWNEQLGWHWTAKGVYPHLFQHSSVNWLYFITKRNGRPYFYNYSTRKLN